MFVDATVHYVDERGEHDGALSEAVDTEEERSRLATVSNDPVWLRAVVRVGSDLLDLAQRSGDGAAWACSSGYFGGADAGPNRIRQAIKSVTGRYPPKPAFGPLAPPSVGRWSVRQVFKYTPGTVSPTVAVWHLGYSQNPRFFPHWCQAITAGPEPPILILPDSPIMRELADSWIRGDRRLKDAPWRGDDTPYFVGTAASIRPRISNAVEVDGSEISGSKFEAALSFLRSHHQLRISPFDLLFDPLLTAQLLTSEEYEAVTSRTASEHRRLAEVRREYERPQEIRRWLEDARRTLPQKLFRGPAWNQRVGSHKAYQDAGLEFMLRAARRALNTGDIAEFLYDVPGPEMILIFADDPDPTSPVGARRPENCAWCRALFADAARRGIVSSEWFSTREGWHAEALAHYPGKAEDFRYHIVRAEKALRSEASRRHLSGRIDPALEKILRSSGALRTDDANLAPWYSHVFEHAIQLGLVTDSSPRKSS